MNAFMPVYVLNIPYGVGLLFIICLGVSGDTLKVDNVRQFPRFPFNNPSAPETTGTNTNKVHEITIPFPVHFQIIFHSYHSFPFIGDDIKLDYTPVGLLVLDNKSTRLK